MEYRSNLNVHPYVDFQLHMFEKESKYHIKHLQQITHPSPQYQKSVFLVMWGAPANYRFYRQYLNFFGDRQNTPSSYLNVGDPSIHPM